MYLELEIKKLIVMTEKELIPIYVGHFVHYVSMHTTEDYTVKNEEFGLLFGGVIMGSNSYGEFK